MSGDPLPHSEIILYQTEDGRTRIQCRLENETLWLTQALISELFQVTVPTVNEHLKGIYAEGELEAGATIRKFRIVRTEGRREVAREIEHYNLDAILAVGFRVRSHRGTQFGELGYAIGHGPHIAPGEAAAERDSFSEVVLVARLHSALQRLNPSISEDAREDEMRKVLRVGMPSLTQTNRPFQRILVQYPHEIRRYYH